MTLMPTPARRRVHKTYEAIAPLSDVPVGAMWESRIEKTPGEIQGRLVAGDRSSMPVMRRI